MPDASPPDDLRLRTRILRWGCILNVLALTVLVGTTVVFLFAIASTLRRGSPAADEAAIRKVLDAQVKAWNRGDLDGFMDGYWRDDELSFTSGDTVTKGWDATRDRYQKKYFTADKDGKMTGRGVLSFEDLQVESLSPTVSMVRGRFVLKSAGKDSTGRFTLTFHKMTDGWKITSDHTSGVDPSAEKKANLVGKE